MRKSLPFAGLATATWSAPRLPRIPASALTLGLQVRRRISTWAFWYTFVLYTAIAVAVYFQFVQPWIAGKIDIRIGADSDRYWNSADLIASGGPTDFVTLTGNFFGPVLVAILLKNGFLVMCFNYLLFGIALAVAASIRGIRWSIFAWLMLANAELFPSLTTLNKEIFALLAAVLTAKYIYSGMNSRVLLFAALVISIFARWEAAAILLLFLLFYRCRPFRGRPKLALCALIAALTVAYPLLFKVLGLNPDMFNYLLKGANTIVVLDKIQYAYGFPVVLIPKVLMLSAGTLVSPWIFWDGTFLRNINDVQQMIFQPLGNLAFLGIALAAFRRGALRPGRPIALLVFITVIVSAVAPFIQPRYLYPVYVLLSLELAMHSAPLRDQEETVVA